MKTLNVENYFNSVAEKYCQMSDALPWSISRYLERKVFYKSLDSVCFDNVLELGPGSGFYTQALLKRHVSRLTVIDCAKKMLDQLESGFILKRHEDFSTYATSEKYSLIVCMGALEFCDNPIEIIHKYVGHLQIGGSFIFMVPNAGVLGGRCKKFHKQNGIDINLFSINSLEDSCRCLNVKIEKRRAFPFSSVYKLESK